MKRRDFLQHAAGLSLAGTAGWLDLSPLSAQTAPDPGFRLVDVTKSAGLAFRHNNGAYGGKLLPETLGSGCAFIDYDNDGWPDVLFVNGCDWPGHQRQRSTLALYRNNRNGTFTDVTKAAGLDIEVYGMGVAVGALMLNFSQILRGAPVLGLFDFRLALVLTGLFSALAVFPYASLPHGAGAEISGTK